MPYPTRFQDCFFLVFLVVPEDGREASRVERWLVRVVIVVGRVVAVCRVVGGVVVPGPQERVAVVAKSKVFGL